MSVQTLPAWARGQLERAQVARLAFLDDRDKPRVLPVTFALAEGAVWSAIDDKPKQSVEPARLRYLRRRPEAALLIDHYADEWEELAWVQLLGRVEIVRASAAVAGLAALIAKYEPYRRHSPRGPFLRFEVQRALSWRASDREG